MKYIITLRWIISKLSVSIISEDALKWSSLIWYNPQEVAQTQQKNLILGLISKEKPCYVMNIQNLKIIK